jgi:hypothetical protein
MTRRAGVLHVVKKKQTRDKVARGPRKGRTNEKRLWKGPECKMEIKDPGIRRQLRFKIEGTSDGFDRKASGLDIVKGSAPSGAGN